MSIKLDFFKVEVVPHHPSWRDAFETESKQIALALTENAIAIHHIGSTAIPQIYAKPIIDMLVEVKDIMKVDAQSSGLEALGYEAMGEFGIPGRRFFRKSNELGIRTHHIHQKTGSEAPSFYDGFFFSFNVLINSLSTSVLVLPTSLQYCSRISNSNPSIRKSKRFFMIYPAFCRTIL